MSKVNVSKGRPKNHSLAHQTSKKHPELGLKYQKLEMNSSDILVFSDDSFSGNNDGSS